MSSARSIEQIKAIVSASEDWSNKLPNDRLDGSWEDVKKELGLKACELSDLKNSLFPSKGTSSHLMLLLTKLFFN